MLTSSPSIFSMCIGITNTCCHVISSEMFTCASSIFGRHLDGETSPVFYAKFCISQFYLLSFRGWATQLTEHVKPCVLFIFSLFACEKRLSRIKRTTVIERVVLSVVGLRFHLCDYSEFSHNNLKYKQTLNFFFWCFSVKIKELRHRQPDER